jgi:hypothetical protein
MTQSSRDEARFWAITEPLLSRASVTRSTMMGLPCLRVNGQFFASLDRRTGSLLVKIPAVRVDELIATGQADPFAPAGRRFREWAAIGTARQQHWPDHLEEALGYVLGQSGP